MIGEIRQNFTEASASVGLILATALLIQFYESEIPLTIEIRKPRPLMTRDPESTARNSESKAVFDCLTLLPTSQRGAGHA